MEKKKNQRIWKPLLSDPDILAEYSKNLGVLSNIHFYDIYSTEEWALEMIPKDPLSILLILPITDKLFEVRRLMSETTFNTSSIQTDIWFMKQFVPNSCGAVAILHSVLNNKNDIEIKKNSFISKILSLNGRHENLAELRGDYLKDDTYIEHMHEELTSRDFFEDSNKVLEVDLHYVSFVICKDRLVELDGRLPYPIDHGECQKESFLKSTIQKIKKYFTISPAESVNVAITALCLK